MSRVGYRGMDDAGMDGKIDGVGDVEEREGAC